MPRIRQDNDARYALRASFVDENGDVIQGDTITIGGPTDPTDPRISDTQIANWDTAYGWGDHASAGYLTSFTETDPTVPAHVKSITTANISNWDTAFGWGNHASAGYALSANLNTSNWDTAYSWGNHASAGYASSSSVGVGAQYVDVAIGNYGTIKVDDDRGVSWAGYAIRDDWVFMSAGVSSAGIYDDTNNSWSMQWFQGGACTVGGGLTAGGEVRGTSIHSDGSVWLGSSDLKLSQNSANNIQYTSGTTGAVGLTMYDSGGTWKLQLYGDGTSTGFLNNNWSGWDLQKIIGGNLILNGSQTVYHTGNLPTIPTNNNQLTNGAGYITSSGSISGNAATATWADTVDVNSSGNNAWYGAVWHSGDTLYSAPGVKINGVGYVEAVYYSATHSTTNRNSDTIFYSSTDNYIRKNDAAGMRSSLNVPTRTGGNASGTWPINVTGSAASATTSAQVSINYSNNSASTYQMLWGSGNYVYATAGINCNPNTNTIYSSSIVTSDWFRSTGNTGWYSNTWGGGINMEDSSWVRVYGNKQFYNSSSSSTAIATPGDVVAGYSDERLKDIEEYETDALSKINGLDAIYYRDNELACSLGYTNEDRKFGLIAQQVQAVLPEVIKRAPVDMDADGGSKSGENYITVDYDRVVPLLVAGIKELTAELEFVKIQLEELRNGSSI